MINPLLSGFHLGSLSGDGLEVEPALALLVEHAIASGAAAAHVHPIGRHHHHRAWAEIPGRRSIGPGVPDAADDHVLYLATMAPYPRESHLTNAAIISNLRFNQSSCEAISYFAHAQR